MEFKLSSPWVIFYNEINELFKRDPEIRVEYDNDIPEIKLFVNNLEKADALQQLLPTTKEFGGAVLKLTVVPANVSTVSKLDLFEKAFKGNPAFSYTKSVGGFSRPVGNFVVFDSEVVQYFNDDLTDINGNCTTLYQEIAKDVFGEIPGLYFCTVAKNEMHSKE